ncbi:MAG: 8-amino-7-oxononanoate synthase [Chthoniobacterales bacterium]
MQEAFESFLENQLEELREANLLRTLPDKTGFTGIEFSSNDYLGLSTHPTLIEAACRATQDFGSGSGASRLITGSLAPHRALETRLAEFKNCDAALSFSTGYATAVGTLFALADRKSVIILDKLCHASIVDGARLSGAELRVFPHNDTEKLASHLDWAQRTHPDARVIIVTESIFSMDGDSAPLQKIVELKNQYGAVLMVDEAHAIGVLGNHGRGLIDALNLGAQVEIQMGTLGKALGAGGGYICGSQNLIDFLTNRARSFIYSTAPPPAQAAAGVAALDLLATQEGENLRLKLWQNIRLWGAQQGTQPESAIVPVIIGEEKQTLELAQQLRTRGMWVPAIRYPTVARGTARLRVSLSARHTEKDINSLSDTIRELTEAR